MEIPSKYDPSGAEEKWYAYWMKHGLFHSEPDEREPYCIVIPPPNVTGVLHMGHMLNNTIQDILVRRARMMGKNTLWVPGTDHASIATEARVVAMLREKGIKKSDLGRDEFLKYAWEWKEKHGGIILEQLKKLGASCDWSRTRFTMDPEMSESVLQVFVDLYRKGHVYRGWRMVNWDPQAKTAISDEEVIYKELQSKLYYVKYKVEGTDEWLTVATTRPETILGDTAVCVHPGDERYRHLKGKRVRVPMVNRWVKLIEDEYVDPEFGTGALKITPAHDVNDYEIGMKHGLEIIDIFNEDGTLSEAAGLFTGEDRFVARDLAVKRLKDEGVLEKVEDYTNKVGFSERTDVAIEPRLSQQWFLRMNELSAPALESVLNNQVKLQPAKFKNTYRHWMENVRDWCISRQLWWGHRIPAWYYRHSDADEWHVVVALSEAEALELARKESGNPGLQVSDLKQDEDVLDTWFSSWLWPISVFDGIRNPENADFRYYYPTDDLVTAPEILFFWVARMIIAGYEYAGEKPFHNVYLTGIVRDKLGRKMSKSLGNSPEPLELIKQYGADGVRVGMLLCSPAGNDLLFEESLTEQGRNFGNKIWNAFRLVKSWKVDEKLEQPEYARRATEWFEARLQQSIHELNRQYSRYKLSEALMNLYKLFWDEFSSWYLEIVKPGYQQPMDSLTHARTLAFLEDLVVLLHPFMPFITEEIWQHLDKREEGESIMLVSLPRSKKFDQSLVDRVEKAKQTISTIRSIRKERNIPPKTSLELLVREPEEKFDNRFGEVVKKLAYLSEIKFIDYQPKEAISFVVMTTHYYLPVASEIDLGEERRKVLEELEYERGFLQSVMKKLDNRKFMENAPEQVVQAEMKKKMDAGTRIRLLEEKLEGLK